MAISITVASTQIAPINIVHLSLSMLIGLVQGVTVLLEIPTAFGLGMTVVVVTWLRRLQLPHKPKLAGAMEGQIPCMAVEIML